MGVDVLLGGLGKLSRVLTLSLVASFAGAGHTVFSGFVPGSNFDTLNGSIVIGGSNVVRQLHRNTWGSGSSRG